MASPHAQWGRGRGRGWGRGLRGAHGAVIFSSAVSLRGAGGRILSCSGRAAWGRDPNFATTLKPSVVGPPAPSLSAPSDPHPVHGRLRHPLPVSGRSPACARAAGARLRPGRSVRLPVSLSLAPPALASVLPAASSSVSVTPSLPSPISLYENICKFPKKPRSRAARGWQLHRPPRGAAD